MNILCIKVLSSLLNLSLSIINTNIILYFRNYKPIEKNLCSPKNQTMSQTQLANNKIVTNNTSKCNILREFNYSNANKERV